MFTDFESRRFRRNRLKLAPNIFRRLGFHVKAVVLAQPPRKKNVDHRFGGLLTTVRGDIRRPQRLDVIHS